MFDLVVSKRPLCYGLFGKPESIPRAGGGQWGLLGQQTNSSPPHLSETHGPLQGEGTLTPSGAIGVWAKTNMGLRYELGVHSSRMWSRAVNSLKRALSIRDIKDGGEGE